jgi:hypothetical protein
MNTEKAQADIARAIRFKEWAEGPEGLYAVFDAVERNYMRTLVQTGITETDVRELIYQRVSALKDVRRAIESVITEGHSAQAMIDKLARQHVRRRHPEKA